MLAATAPQSAQKIENRECVHRAQVAPLYIYPAPDHLLRYVFRSYFQHSVTHVSLEVRVRDFFQAPNDHMSQACHMF